jgi:hypothetical protein
MAGARGLVRLLLFRGAPVDYAVRKAVVDEIGGGKNRYRGFGRDVREAKCWQRWITDGNIGGLPEEITRMLMLMHFENASDCAKAPWRRVDDDKDDDQGADGDGA